MPPAMIRVGIRTSAWIGEVAGRVGVVDDRRQRGDDREPDLCRDRPAVLEHVGREHGDEDVIDGEGRRHERDRQRHLERRHDGDDVKARPRSAVGRPPR